MSAGARPGGAAGSKSSRTTVSCVEAVAAPAGEHDELAGLADALAELTPNQRRAILLREWQGLSYREIADRARDDRGGDRDAALPRPPLAGAQARPLAWPRLGRAQPGLAGRVRQVAVRRRGAEDRGGDGGRRCRRDPGGPVAAPPRRRRRLTGTRAEACSHLCACVVAGSGRLRRAVAHRVPRPRRPAPTKQPGERPPRAARRPRRSLQGTRRERSPRLSRRLPPQRRFPARFPSPFLLRRRCRCRSRCRPCRRAGSAGRAPGDASDPA